MRIRVRLWRNLIATQCGDSHWFAHKVRSEIRRDSEWHVSAELDRIEELELLILMPSERLRQLSIFSLL